MSWTIIISETTKQDVDAGWERYIADQEE